MEHVFWPRTDDIKQCKFCNGAEATLPTDCPGSRLTLEEEEAIGTGQLDFSEGLWTNLPIH